MRFMLALNPPITVVMVHGAGGGGWEYDKWKPVFEAKGYKVVNRDLLPVNHDYAKTKLSDYVKQVVSWCPKEGSVILIGASMGGRIALEASQMVHPIAMVLVNSVPPQGLGSKAFPPIVKWANGPLKDTIDSMPDSDHATILWAWKRWRNESGQVMHELSQGQAVIQPNCPVIVVIGEKDDEVPPAKSHFMAQQFHAKVLSYPGMSHVGPLLSRSAERVARDVVRTLEESSATDHASKA